MSKEALNSVYRPQCLAEIVGQDITTSIIAKQISSKKVAPVYLFVGPAGTGKTSLARVMAKELNSIPVEVNAAVFNSVGDVRELNQDSMYQKLGQETNFYILDEVQNYRKDAWSAALKMLEEPAEHTVFVLCTTEFQKIPKTILSRSQVYYFKPVQPETIAERLGIVCNDAKIEFDNEALDFIARSSFGCVRDALQKLDQVASIGKVTIENAKSVIPDFDILQKVLVDRDLSKLEELEYSSVTVDSFIQEAIQLAIAGKLNKQIALGLVKLRPFITYVNPMATIKCYLLSAFETWK